MKKLLIMILCFASAAGAEDARKNAHGSKISKIGNTQIDPNQFRLDCLEELQGEVSCTVGKPCGPFYKKNTPECIAYRSHISGAYLSAYIENVKVTPLKISNIKFELLGRCYEELRGEIQCTAGKPCGPFYKDRSPECVNLRKSFEADLFGSAKGQAKERPSQDAKGAVVEEAK